MPTTATESVTPPRRRQGLRVRSKIIAFAVVPLVPVFLWLGWHQFPAMLWDVQLEEATEGAKVIAELLARHPGKAAVDESYDAAHGRLLYVATLGVPGIPDAFRAEGDSVLPDPDIRVMAQVDGERRHYRELWIATPALNGGRALVAVSLDRASATWFRTRIFFLGVTLAALLVAAILASVLSRHVTAPLASMSRSLGEMTAGDRWKLDSSFNERTRDEVGEAATAINQFIRALGTVVESVTQTSTLVAERAADIARSTRQLGDAGDELARGAGQVAADADRQAQAATLSRDDASRAAAAADDVLTSVTGAEARSREALGAAEVGLAGVEAADAAVERVVSTASASEESFARLQLGLTVIVKAAARITSIAQNTNLIALNAAIEASRAGEHGKGFAVVAAEVRRLANDSGRLSHEIRREVKLIEGGVATTAEALGRSTAAVQEARSAIADTSSAIRSAASGVQATAAVLTSVSETAREQRTGSRRIEQEAAELAGVAASQATAARQMALSTEQQMNLVSEISRELGALQVVAAELQRTVARFTV